MPDLESSASRGIVMRNQISFGMDCYQIDASSNMIFEDNHCLGINLFSRGSGMVAPKALNSPPPPPREVLRYQFN